MSEFLWGTATAAYQIEGGNFNNDWWEWERSGHIKGGDSAQVACDSWNHWRDDLDASDWLGANAYRFSVEWSRLEPEEGRFNEAALARYLDMLQEMKKRGIEPVLTLHHFTLPLWLARRGGCESADFAQAFARFCSFVVPILGPLVRWWVTINEPNVVAALGYLYGVFPPGVKSLGRTRIVMRNLILAHAAGYRIIKKVRSDAQISIALNMLNATPASPALQDRLAARLIDQAYHRSFLDACTSGKVGLPMTLAGRIPEAARTMDYIGLNYYTRNYFALRLKGGLVEVRKQVSRSDMDQEMYPQGFYQALKEVGSYGLPVMVTEHGIADREDRWRAGYLRECLDWMKKAMSEGVQVTGYLHWSLLDNFEWNEGYSQRFGLFQVDFKTLLRTPRPSAAAYREIILSHRNLEDWHPATTS
jgi:beta-glucosidase